MVPFLCRPQMDLGPEEDVDVEDGLLGGNVGGEEAMQIRARVNGVEVACILLALGLIWLILMWFPHFNKTYPKAHQM